MDYDEFKSWMAFYTLEPFGAYIENWRSAMIAQSFGGGDMKDYFPVIEREGEPVVDESAVERDNRIKAETATLFMFAAMQNASEDQKRNGGK